MRPYALRNALLAVVLLAVGVGGGYLGAKALDDEDSSPAATGDTSSTSSPAEGTTPTVAGPGGATGTAVVISPLGVLGWWSDGAWVQASERAEAPVRGGERYTVLGLDGEAGTAVGSKLGVTCEISEPYPAAVELDPPFAEDAATVAVTGVGDPVPRRAEALSTESDTYRAAASEALAAVGIQDARPNIAQLLRIDLEGDGSDEILITAERIDRKDFSAKAGEYTAVIIRRLVDGKVRSQVIEQFQVTKQDEGSTPYLLEHKVAAIADLNGDGRMEVVLDSRYYEGSAFGVYADGGDGKLAQVIAAGCGA